MNALPLRPHASGDPASGETPGCAQPQLSVVVCTHDEHESIARVLDELAGVLPLPDYEILVVDDSRDERTADAVRDCAHPAAAPARHGRLVRRGDGQHDPRMIAGMFEAIRHEPLDLIVASRYMDGDGSGLGRLRHAVSRGGIWLTDRMLGIPLADPLSGCFMMTRAWYATVRPQLSGLSFKILVDVVVSAERRPRVAQLPTLLRMRLGGASKLTMRVVLDLIQLLIEKRSRGRLSSRRLMLLGIGAIALAIWLATTDLAIHWGSTVPLALGLALLVALGCAEFIARRLKLKLLRRS